MTCGFKKVTAFSSFSAVPCLKARARESTYGIYCNKDSANKLLGNSEFSQGKKNMHFLPSAHCEVLVEILHDGDIPSL